MDEPNGTSLCITCANEYTADRARKDLQNCRHKESLCSPCYDTFLVKQLDEAENQMRNYAWRQGDPLPKSPTCVYRCVPGAYATDLPLHLRARFVAIFPLLATPPAQQGRGSDEDSVSEHSDGHSGREVDQSEDEEESLFIPVRNTAPVMMTEPELQEILERTPAGRVIWNERTSNVQSNHRHAVILYRIEAENRAHAFQPSQVESPVQDQLTRQNTIVTIGGRYPNGGNNRTAIALRLIEHDPDKTRIKTRTYYVICSKKEAFHQLGDAWLRLRFQAQASLASDVLPFIQVGGTKRGWQSTFEAAGLVTGDVVTIEQGSLV